MENRTNFPLLTPAFPFQQLLLSFQSPAIAAKALVFTHNAMTRDHERNGIRCTRAPDRANRARFAQRLRHLAIGDCFSVRDSTQLLPNLSLKGGRSDVQRQIKTWVVVIEMIQNLLYRVPQ